MKYIKILSIIVIIINIISLLYSNETILKTNKDANLYDINSVYKIIEKIKIGEKVFWINQINKKINKDLLLKIRYGDNNKYYYISINDLIIENSDMFDNDIVNDSIINNEHWIPIYYDEILKANDRNLILKHEPDWKSETLLTDDYLPFSPMSFCITNLFIWGDQIYSGGISFTIKNIKKNNAKEYFIKTYFESDIKNLLKSDFNINLLNNRHENNIILKIHPNRNKIRLYNDDGKTIICELVRVSDKFYNQYSEFVRTNKVPADLDMPKGVDDPWPKYDAVTQTSDTNDVTTTAKSDTNSKSYQTTVSLRIRESSSTTAKIITTLPQGTKVEVLEKGKADTINGIKGNWVKVKTDKGETGWCFDGYLSPLTP